jgi:alpha-D-ribose 1-methylphosphonate 5-triphosphate synthase subunit PhnI
MYVAVKGGERAIDNAHRLLAAARRGDPAVPELSLEQISEQLALAVDRVMAEGSLYDRELAALAIKQARGDLIEAIFLVRAYRTTLPRFGASEPVDTGAMETRRRISAAFKDLPGGQVLGPTFDYTHRLLDVGLAAGGATPSPHRGEGIGGPRPPFLGLKTPTQSVGYGEGVTGPSMEREPPHPDSARERAESDLSPPGRGEEESCAAMPRVTDLLADDGLIEMSPPGDPAIPVGDLTREPLTFPAGRDVRLQNLARGDEGFLLALGYSTQRGYGRTHPFAGEIRLGEVEVEFMAEEIGFAVPLGRITVTECQMINQFRGSATEPPQFTRGYGLAFGHCERKAMAMALVDRALRARELSEEKTAPAQDEEFVLSHSDNVQATGFVEHLKLPHYVDFQAELGLVRRMRAEIAAHGDVREAAE